jgi:drug/metabolite transporter (DMT)-like permease
MRLYWFAFAIIVAGITFLVVADVFTDFDTVRGDQIVSIVALSAVLIVASANMVGRYAGQSGMFLQHLVIWLGIIAVLALVYQYREMLGLNFD